MELSARNANDAEGGPERALAGFLRSCRGSLGGFVKPDCMLCRSPGGYVPWASLAVSDSSSLVLVCLGLGPGLREGCV